MALIRSKHGRAELRKTARKPLQGRAQIDAGDGMFLRECTVLDLSDQGARLMIAPLNEVPDEFVLLLSNDGHVRRCCRVVRRSDQEIGVTFVSGS